MISLNHGNIYLQHIITMMMHKGEQASYHTLYHIFRPGVSMVFVGASMDRIMAHIIYPRQIEATQIIFVRGLIILMRFK